MRRAIARMTARWEKIASSSATLAELYCLPYREVVRREIVLAGIRPGQTVLCVGCGAVPFTAVHLSRLGLVKVEALDCDPSAAAAARDCVQRLGLDTEIRIWHADAAEVIPADFDAAIVALQAEPKGEILEMLLAAGASEAGIVFRSASASFGGQYDELPSRYRPHGWTRQNMRTFDRSILYRIPAKRLNRGINYAL